MRSTIASVGVVIALGLCAPARGENALLLGANLLDGRGDHRLELLLGKDLQYISRETRHDGAWAFILQSPDRGAPLTLRERLDVNSGAIGTVTLEGGVAGGYRLLVSATPSARLRVVPQSDYRRLQVSVVVAEPQEPDRHPVSTAGSEDGSQAMDRDAPLLVEARDAASAGEYAHAIALYTQALSSGDAQTRMWALELLGVTREQNGQLAHAKALYDQFLEEYPDSPAAPRVQQRLTGLVTRNLPTRQRTDNPPTPSGLQWLTTGSISQFYHRYELEVGDQPAVVALDAVYSDVDVDIRRQSGNSMVGARLSGSYLTDLTGDDPNAFRFSGVYLETELYDPGLHVRVGRQTRRTGGVLGRFDGLNVSYDVTDSMTLHSTMGYLVDSTYDGFHNDRTFYGLSAEFRASDDDLRWAPYVIEQRAQGLTDRRAVGLEFQYYRSNATVFSLVDYDVFHHELNNIHMLGNARLGEHARLNLTVNRRRSPFLTTRNALIGQPFEDLDALAREFAHGEIENLAADRTATVDLVSMTFDRDLGERLELGFDVSSSRYSSTEESGNVSRTPARSYTYYTVRLSAEDLVTEGSYSTMQLRFVDADTYRMSSIYLSSRLRPASGWSVYPRLRADHRSYVNTDRDQWKLVPSLRIDFRPGRWLTFELEVGYEWTRQDLQVDELDVRAYYVRAGYRWLF